MMSLISIALSVARSGSDSADGAGGAAPVVAALLLATLFGNIFSGVSGFYFWSAVGFATSSRTYQQAVVLARRVASLPAPPPRPRLITSPHTTSAA